MGWQCARAGKGEELEETGALGFREVQGYEVEEAGRLGFLVDWCEAG